ncbi:MAG: BspA family leucine-rich repeat surface protein [Bacteroidota bacterium]
MVSMFSGATSANPDVSNWNTTNVTNMKSMFSGATSANPDVSNWNTANVIDMSFMFDGAILANPDLSSWDVTSVTNMQNIFRNITLPRPTYDAILIHFNSQNIQPGLDFHGGNSKYCAIAAHDNLTNAITGHSWMITDGGIEPNCPLLTEYIFSNSFENVVVFKVAVKQFVYDFAKDVLQELDQQPLLIAQGIDNQHKTTIKIYLRNDLGQLQIRMDNLYPENIENKLWTIGKWQLVDNKQITRVSW